MNSRNLLLTLIAGWIVFIGLDSAQGRMGSSGIRLLRKPVQVLYGTTKIVRTIVLFFMAISTLLVVASPNSRSRKAQTNDYYKNMD